MMLLYFLQTIFSWIFFFIECAVVLPCFLLVSLLINKKQLDNRLVHIFCSLVCKTIFFDLKLTYLDPSKKEYADFPVIYVANHVSFFDLFICGAILPGDPRGFEVASHFSKPFYGWFLTRFGEIPIDATKPGSVLMAIKQGCDVLQRRERNLLIMPEAHRTRDGKLGRFQNGAFFLSKESGVPIVPVVFGNLYRRNNASTYLIKGGRVDILMGKPFYPQDYQNKQQLSDAVREEMERILSSAKSNESEVI